jgi:hypothetical protein
MKIDFKTTKFDVQVYGLTDYLNIGDVVYDCKVEKVRNIFWNIDLITFGEGINEIKFGVESVYISFSWDISLMQLEEYEAIMLQEKFGASVSRDDVFGFMTIDNTWDIEFTNPKDLKDSASFEFRPEQAIIYVDEKRVVIS